MKNCDKVNTHCVTPTIFSYNFMRAFLVAPQCVIYARGISIKMSSVGMFVSH
jgi:hypothetical protein